MRSSGFVPVAVGTGEAAGPTTWGQVQGKPAAYPPSPHRHSLEDVQGLDQALSTKADASDPGDLTLLFENALV
jgi:hypothetical protein